jgi:carbamoyltransferase
MITLGINAAFHDSAAALAVDGAIVAAAEEERFSRIKHGKRPLPFTAWELPFNAIDFCLAQAGITLADLDHVAYSFDPREFLGGRSPDGGVLQLPFEPSLGASPAGENPWDALFAAYVVNAPRQLVDGAPHHLQRRFALPDKARPPYRWHFVNHHACHQASAFLAAPFERCAVMTLDGRGERATTTYGAWSADAGYRPLGEVTMPHSLGLLYERVTTHLGFLHSSDEYKVMALAALGRPEFRSALRDHVHVGADGRYAIDPIDMTALFGAPRERGAPLLQRHFDLAASLQAVLEESVLKIAAWLRRASGEPCLAMAGGVALNCVMNARLRDSDIFEQVWVQPAAGDAGTALGAALWVDAEARAAASAPAQAAQGRGPAAAPRRWQMEHAYLGPAYDDATIEHALQWAKLPYTRHATTEALAAATARLLLDNRIVGWFQGRMEFGPRALGARSILASPIDPAMQARLNELKDREDFRPVAPALPREALADWFAPAEANGGVSPFMLFVYDVVPGRAVRIPSACHTDHTARVQTVDAASNPRFHALLQAFGALSGVPVLVNTSFNVRGEPIVCTPRNAIEAFYSTSLDALVIGSFIVEKHP